jgi:hypothetical protein
MSELTKLDALPRGTRLLFSGDELIAVPDAIADRFAPGDSLVIADYHCAATDSKVLAWKIAPTTGT